MITQGQERQIQRSGLMGERKFGIALTPKMYSMMSDKLYTDRVGSVVREVCSNAWDAQKMQAIATGQPQEPFKVTLPTDLEPHFIVEDTGPGMPDDVAQDLYSTLGLSTKENTNDQIGAFGLGSKSPFAVTDTFTVENTYEGVTYHYLCFKNEDGLPAILKTGETQDGRPNGVKIVIPAAGSKYLEYKQALNRQLVVMEPKPILCNIEEFKFIEPDKSVVTPEGFILGNASSLGLYARRVYARMGMVLYPVEMNQIDIEYGKAFHEKLGTYSALVLEFPIGALEPVPSREGLSYEEKTIKNLKDAYNKFAVSYMAVLKKTVEEQPTPLDAWRKIKELRDSTNINLMDEGIYNLGFPINNNWIDNAFPYFDYKFKDKRIKENGSWVFDDEGNQSWKEATLEEFENTKSISQFYYEEFSGSDTRLNIKREAMPMRVSWQTLDQIEKGLIKILIMDETEPKYRIGRMKSVLNELRGKWNTTYWVVRVDERSGKSLTDFREFIISFGLLHRGITSKFKLFSSVPKPETERRKREEDGPIEGVMYRPLHSRYEVRVKWADIDTAMSPTDADEEDDDYEEQCEKAKAEFLSKHFYLEANRNELIHYGSLEMKDITDFAKERGYGVYIIRKTGTGKLKDLKDLGLKEFKEFLNEKLDGHEVSDDYKKYSSAKMIASRYPFWFRFNVKLHLSQITDYLTGTGGFIHPFLAELKEINRLANLDSMLVGADPETRLINDLRLKRLIQFFDGYAWSKIEEIDVSEQFESLAGKFEQFYPAFSTLARNLESHSGINPLMSQYITDYNALRGTDVDFEEFEQQVEVKETE